MAARKQETRVILFQILDALLVAFAVWLAWKVRTWQTVVDWVEDVTPLNFPAVAPFDEFVWLLYVLMPAIPLVLEYLGFYSLRNQASPWRNLRRVGTALTIVLMVVGVLTIFFRAEVDSRLVMALSLLISAVLLFGRNRLAWAWWCRARRNPESLERVLLAGHPSDMSALRREFDGPTEGVEVVGEFDLIEGSLDEFVDLLHRESIERVFFCAEHLHFKHMESAVQTCELEGVEAWLSTRFLRATTVEPRFDQFSNHPMLVFRSSPDHGWPLLVKELFDRVGAFFLLLLSAPFWLIAIIGIKRSDPGPVLFAQQRGGKHGKPFTMYKFRSMYVDAEARREELMARNQMSGPVFKIDDDPRIFPFGEFMRRTSWDELPQLVNVLLGHMSLVGPRPLPVYEVEMIVHSRQRRRLSVRPGLTCLWQISGRNEITDFDDWVQLDLEYIDRWSLWLDIRILVCTVPVVLLRRGAR